MALGRHLFFLVSIGVLAAGMIVSGAASSVEIKRPKIDYNRDIRPIITKCFSCHGHDAKAVMADLRLDQRDTATLRLADGKYAIVPGHPEQSELIARINAKDPGDLMPPPESNKVLSADDKAMMREWIKQGAQYKPHWAFVAPVRPAIPHLNAANSRWARSPIDAFVAERLEQEGLHPSSEADRRTLIRRVSLDLTGLLPTPVETQAFVDNKAPNAYEKVVDRFLASPRYGERMAMDWMDDARYADSNGYQADYERYQWRWRDWVIDAFNKNMPFDRFTVEQIAGDMLPNATMNQIIATGFNRNHRINTEGGVIVEEWRVETVIDRVETTSQTWLGLTAGCARCHDHKYDPISQKEFYGLYAYFNNVPETGSGEERPVNHPPLISAPYPEQQAQLLVLDQRLVALRERQQQLRNTSEEKAQEWQLASMPEPPKDKLLLRANLPSLATDEAVKKDIGRSTGAIVTGEKASIDLGNQGDFDQWQPFTYAVWINPKNGSGAPISKMDVAHGFRGWDLFLSDGRPAIHIINDWPKNALKVNAKAMIPNGAWSHVCVTYDGSRKPSGIHFYINGRDVGQETEMDTLTGSIHTDVTLKVGRRTGADAFAGKVDDLLLYSRAISAAEVQQVASVSAAAPILRLPKEQRSAVQRRTVVHEWLLANNVIYKALDQERDKLSAGRVKLSNQISTVMIMAELPRPRDAFVLVRGQYDKRGVDVSAGIPKAFPPLPKGAPNNRLGFARWLVSPANPLTARVAVNRMWERLFGIGIVETSEDFGTRATFPSHPELLDWLATELIQRKWNQKALWKELVMSATYRQSAHVSRELTTVDPLNRLLARGPRFRLNAEVLRDQAMQVGGILTEKIGGPSVRPYQPDGVWDEVNVYGNLRNYKHDMGAGLRRRSLYTIWKRTAAPPLMTLFDSGSRETCRVRRSRTDTPLQALAMLNDTTYVEAARALAIRMLKEGGATADARVKFAYEAVLIRPPRPEEARILLTSIARNLSAYRVNPKAAKELISEGDLRNPPGVDPAVLAAYTLAASTILNLDEAITKQ